VVHRHAKGFLGFKKVTAVNPVMGVKTISESEINTQWALPYAVKQTSIRYADNSTVSESFITNSFINLSTGSHDIRYFQKIDKTLNVDHLNGKAAESVNTYDNYGNVTVNVAKAGVLAGTTVTPTETTTTTTAYGIHNTPVPAKPDNVTVSNTRTGMPAISATTIYTYTTNGNLQSETSFSGLPRAVTTTNTFNNLGNITQTVTSAAGMGNRNLDITYDARGRFPLTKTTSGGGLSETETATYNPLWGKPASQTSADCRTVLFTYDNFGRPSITNFSSLSYQANHYLYFYIDQYPHPLYYSQTLYSANKPDTWTWFDKLGRELKNESGGFDPNQTFTQLTTYDNRGRLFTKTNVFFPYVPNYPYEPPLLTTTTYDDYNRPVSVSNILNTTTTSYTTLTGGKVQVTTQNSAGQSQSKIMDAAGKTVSAIDNGGQLDYTYDSRGNQVEVKHDATVLVTSVYDEYGRQTSLTDKNAGTITYQYDAYGQLTQQTDANSNTHTMTYDGMGKIANRTGPEGPTIYEYHPAGSCWANKPWKITGFSGEVKEILYDAVHPDLPATEKVTIDGNTYTTTFAYDQYGNLTHTYYPGFVVVQNAYNADGYLTQISGGNLTSPVTLFTINSINSHGQYTGVSNGSGAGSTNNYYYGIPTRRYTPYIQDQNYTWDYSKGNLLSRNDAIKNITETFQYDNLNRLTNTTVNGTPQLTMGYDGSGIFSMGNITSKTDAGNYVYYNNANGIDKIHAVAYITNPAGPTAPPVSHPVGLQELSYTAFLKTASISENGVVSKEFIYGSDYQRQKMNRWAGMQFLGSKYYFGGYEVITQPGGDAKIIYYISNGENLGAIMEKTGQHPKYIATPLVTRYVYTDYLGSPLTLTDNTGLVVAEQNFDAWGRYRNVNTWQYEPQGYTPPAPFYNRGYTGHEHLPEHYLINMNGRMYDPIMGRMLSPDNYVPDPWHTQGYNRYSYANNNPLSFVDPDGNNPIVVAMIVGAIFGAYSGGVTANNGQLNPFKWNWNANTFGYMFGGAVVGGLSALTGIGVATSLGTTLQIPTAGLIASGVGGMSAGLIGGFGFSALNGADPILGAFRSAITGFIGNSFSAYISGGVGAFVGGMVSGGLSSALSGENWYNILRSSLTGGGSSWASHQVSSFVNYKKTAKSYSKLGIDLKRKQFNIMSRSGQKSFTRGIEYGGYLTKEGGVEMWPKGIRAKVFPGPRDGNEIASFHTHPNYGPGWVQEHSPVFDGTGIYDMGQDLLWGLNSFVLARQTVFYHNLNSSFGVSTPIGSILNFNPYPSNPSFFLNYRR